MDKSAKTIGKLSTALIVILSVSFFANQAFGFTRNPSGDPAEEPITITLSQSDFYDGSCANGMYAAIAVRFDGQAPGYASITDWVISDGSSDITWTDLTLADGFGYEHTPHPETGPIDVLRMDALCNINPAYDYGWGNLETGAPFEWQTASEPPTPTESDQVYAVPLAIIVFELSIILCLLAFKR